MEILGRMNYARLNVVFIEPRKNVILVCSPNPENPGSGLPQADHQGSSHDSDVPVKSLHDRSRTLLEVRVHLVNAVLCFHSHGAPEGACVS